jgi:hypothetical protein
VAACFMSGSVTNRLPARHYLEVPKVQKLLSRRVPTCDCVQCCGWEVMANPPSTLLRRTWLVSGLLQMLTGSKLSSPGYRNMTPIPSTPGYKRWYQGGTNARTSLVSMWRVDVYHLLPVCCVYSVYWSQNGGLGNSAFGILFLWKSVCVSHLRTYFIAAGRHPTEDTWCAFDLSSM